MRQRLKIEVRGVVQGVGYRPFIYRLAQRFALNGSVRNSEAGVSIEVQGEDAAIASFLLAMRTETPPLANVIETRTLTIPPEIDAGFSILPSTHGGNAGALISPDIATCAGCIAEIFDPANRRYLYPFINCTNCGPRFTITHGVPYDRRQTSMASFTMCERCQAEYDDPMDRRFHAQPNACWECGPQLQLLNRYGLPQQGDPVAEARRYLRLGAIIAVKGLGGFHLAVDANQPRAVQELRLRKHRGERPLAMMVRDIDVLVNECRVTNEEAKLLAAQQRPIVLLNKLTSRYDTLAPDSNDLGILLPYTPLHHLLLAESALTALVMTSGNLTDEPIAIDNAEALRRLADIADYFLVHNRDILLRCDDSVLRTITECAQFSRRSRGYVPSPVLLREPVPCVLAVGGELKNTVCLSRGAAAFLGQHIGDLEDLSAYDFFQESIAHFKKVLGVSPEVIAHDLHPGYLSTQWARRQTAIPLIGVQHHYAHIASCMAEHQLAGPVIGVALDGTGYGTDGQAWGGEVLIADLDGFERAAHLAYVPLPGGAQAIQEPWRMAVSYLLQAFGADWQQHLPTPWLACLPSQKLEPLQRLLQHSSLASTSSCGRLFDAVAALALQRTHVSYEAQSAIALEACCDTRADLGAYAFDIQQSSVETCLHIGTAPLFVAIAEDLRRGTNPGIISRRFHNGLVDAFADAVLRVAQRTELQTVCLSGGSFQNAQLSQGLLQRLTTVGLTVYTHKQVPPGDGGLSLGQLVIAAHQHRP